MRLSRIHEEQAQGVIEFALIATILMLIFLGTVDFARFMYYQTAIHNAARAGSVLSMTGCGDVSMCAHRDSTSLPDFITQAAVCEGRPYVPLNPYPTSFDFCANCSAYCTSGSACVPSNAGIGYVNPCSSNMCTQDVCVNPSTGPFASGAQVTLSVGYSFKPIAPYLLWLFPNRSCWSAPTSDPTSNHHTLCASLVGRAQ